MLDFRIDTFLAVCKFMNFTKASQYLNITQPAVSGHIRYLEEYYQVKLFVYSGKKMH
uniref:helix-turn-helix domain-containing protein n=1 Tax=Thomasclavelia sp. TaxID=3025757 RepID=UPI0025DDB1E4